MIATGWSLLGYKSHNVRLEMLRLHDGCPYRCRKSLASGKSGHNAVTKRLMRIIIPATVAIGRRLGWARVVAVGAHVQTVRVGNRVLFDPEDRAEVEVRGKDYVLLRERDLHAVAAERPSDGRIGLYV
jgi:chaperonin GroES